jgi:hypothetical protein
MKQILFSALIVFASCTPQAETMLTEATKLNPINTITSTAFPSFTPITSTAKSIDPIDLSQMNVEEWVSTSSDSKWVAVGLVAFPKENIGGQFAYVRLLVFSTDGKIHWTIVDEWQEIGLGFPIPSPLKWSQDGKHFYFTHRANPDGCSAFPFITDLQQVNLENGNVQNLLPSSAAAVAVSPDDSQAAYTYYSYFSIQPELRLAVRNLTTGKEQETKIDPGKVFNAGNLMWAPDGKSLVLTLAINPCAGEYDLSKTVWAESTTILLVDAETLQQKILIEEDPRLFITMEWNELTTITITDGAENSVWHLDVNTGEINRP